MRTRSTVRRAAWAALLALLLAGGNALAQDNQEKKEPADPEKTEKAAEKEKKDSDAGAADEDAMAAKSAAEVAGSLRDEGELVSQTGDLKVSVSPNLFTEFPGFDLDALSEEQRKTLIKESNAVYCTCGCRGDTVARCVVLDPSCQVARKMLQKMIDDLTAPAQAKADGAEAE